MKKLHLLLFVGVTVFMMGCQSDGDSASDSDKTLKDDAGNEVALPEDPERIVAPYLEDDLLALEETPVVQWSVNGGENIQEYLQDEGLDDREIIPHDMPFEVVASHEPDLIMTSASDLADGEDYDNYSAIAPTFVVESGNYNNWRERLTRVSEVFDKEELAEEKINEYNQLTGEISEGLPEEETAMAIWWTGDDFFISNMNEASGEVLYNDLDLSAPPLVEELSAEDENPWMEASLETLAESEVDHIFFIGNDEGDSEEAFSDNVFQNIPAVESGNVYEYTQEDSWLYSGYIANTQIAEDVEGALSE